ncbi:MAG TPA: IS630 family transposase [Armatimonadota bacterium]|nr:IS630 family transposase [Armatimonadota bacterium]
MVSAGCASVQVGGASPLFSPKQPQEAKDEILDTIRRDPRQLGVDQSRWSHHHIRQHCSFLANLSDSGIHRILDRLGISYKRGRDYVHSPDPDYQVKLQLIADVVAEVRADPQRLVLLYQDEVTYYRQPTVARAYEQRGRHQALARRSHAHNTPTRVSGALNLLTGRVSYRQGSCFGIDEMVRFYEQLCRDYPHATRIYLVQDNWPVHYHPDVLVALEPQQWQWPRRVPKNWPTQPSRKAQERWESRQLPIQVLSLPTYASWANPIEKLWRWLKQDVLHLHRLADDITALRQLVVRFLDTFAQDSVELLRYVGLEIPD